MTICVCKTQIPKGGRSVTVALKINWGDEDLRDSSEKETVFCSFRCLQDWAGDRAIAHDGQFVQEGIEGL